MSGMCTTETGLQPPARFTAVADLHLPDQPWPALEAVEILQRAGRWQDAAEAARHIAVSTPIDREHETRVKLAAPIPPNADGHPSGAVGHAWKKGRL